MADTWVAHAMETEDEIERINANLAAWLERLRRMRKRGHEAGGGRGPVTYLDGRRVSVPGSGEGNVGGGLGDWNGPPGSNANQPPGGGG